QRWFPRSAPAQDLARTMSRHLAVAQRDTAVDDDMPHARGEAIWLEQGSRLAKGVRIEDYDVGVIAGLQQTAVTQPKDRCGQARQAPHRFLHRKEATFAN